MQLSWERQRAERKSAESKEEGAESREQRAERRGQREKGWEFGDVSSTLFVT